MTAPQPWLKSRPTNEHKRPLGLTWRLRLLHLPALQMPMPPLLLLPLLVALVPLAPVTSLLPPPRGFHSQASCVLPLPSRLTRPTTPRRWTSPPPPPPHPCHNNSLSTPAITARREQYRHHRECCQLIQPHTCTARRMTSRFSSVADLSAAALTAVCVLRPKRSLAQILRDGAAGMVELDDDDEATPAPASQAAPAAAPAPTASLSLALPPPSASLPRASRAVRTSLAADGPVGMDMSSQ